MTPAQVSGRTTVAASRRAAYPSRSRSVIRAQVTTDALIERAKTLTDDLKAMNTKMPTIRRVVAGNRNDLKALQLYQDALEGRAPSEDDEDAVRKLENTLDDLATYVQAKAEEEQFWEGRKDVVTSSIVSGMVANFTMMGVQAGVWNALILLIGFVSLVTFVLPNI